MSAGIFEKAKYQADNGLDIYPVRVQEETMQLVIDGIANDEPAAAKTMPVRARIAGKRRQIGMNCRKIRIEFTGAPPAGYALNQVLTVPILTPDMFNGIEVDDTGTYLGVPIIVIGKTPEYAN